MCDECLADCGVCGEETCVSCFEELPVVEDGEPNGNTIKVCNNCKEE